MGFLKKVLYFIGGKPPQIIFKNGEVYHDHKPEKWQKWKDRFEKDPNYNWHKHSGFSGKSNRIKG